MSASKDPEEEPKPPRVAITLGDPNGIGPEVVLKSLSDTRIGSQLDPVLVGSPHVLRVHAEQLGLDLPEMIPIADATDSVPVPALGIVDPWPDEEPPVAPGEVTGIAGDLAMKSVSLAVDMAMQGDVDAIVTAPISKAAIALAGHEFPGHTEFLAQRTKTTSYTMMMVAGALRVGLLTAHISLANVVQRANRVEIKRRLKSIAQSLQDDFGIARPKIAVLALNPHAGEGGVLGSEESSEIVPAVKDSCKGGLLAFGPFPADGFFGSGTYRAFDAVLAMYHDQGLIPFKTLSFGRGVNFTAGLPIVRTSPDHGTAFEIAGQNRASEGSMRHAMYLATDIVRQRRRRM